VLNTDLEHIETEDEFRKLLEDNQKVAVCCGRMGPMCIPVYGIFEELREKYTDVRFVDMDFDIPVAALVKSLPQCQTFMGLPFTVYYLDNQVVKATSSIQTAKEVKSIVNDIFK